MYSDMITLLLKFGFRNNITITLAEQLKIDEYFTRFDGNYHYIHVRTVHGYTSFEFYKDGRYKPIL